MQISFPCLHTQSRNPNFIEVDGFSSFSKTRTRAFQRILHFREIFQGIRANDDNPCLGLDFYKNGLGADEFENLS